MHIFGEDISLIELAGTLFGIIGVLLVVLKNIWNFPAGIVNVSLYAWLFLKTKLYADASLQLVYVLLLVYGWFQWSRKKSGEAFHAQLTSVKLWMILTLIFIGSSILIGTLFKNYTDASLPYFDSALTSASLIAQWMIAKRKIENWIVWIVADVLYIGMYIYKHLYFTSLLYFIFIILAIVGYIEWKRILATNE